MPIQSTAVGETARGDELFSARSLTSIRRGLLSVSLDLHATSDSGVGLTAGQVSHVDEGIVECGQDVADTEDVLSLLAGSCGRRSVVSDLLFLASAFFTFASIGTTLLSLSL
jgi:hypothetical protein